MSVISKPSSGIVGDFVLATAKKTVEKTYIDNSPPLDLWYTAPKNIQEFYISTQKIKLLAAKLGYVGDILSALLQWERPVESFAVCIVWILICSYPRTVFYVPSLFLLCYSIYNWYERVYEATLRDGPIKRKAIKTSPLPANRSTDLASINASLQKLQNSLGKVNELMVQLELLHSDIEWTDEERSLEVTLLIVASMPAIGLATHIVPLNFIVCVVGLLVMVGTTPVFQAIVEVAVQSLNKLGQPIPIDQPTSHMVSPAIPKPLVTKAYSSVFLYENQRWVIGLGWGQPLASERPAFSDATGLEARDKHSLKLPKGTEWLDAEWTVATNGYYPTVVDSDGWEYANQIWMNWGANKNGWMSCTRRRQWKRSVVTMIEE